MYIYIERKFNLRSKLTISSSFEVLWSFPILVQNHYNIHSIPQQDFVGLKYDISFM